MGKLLTLSDVVNVGRNKKKKIEELVNEKGLIFELIKKGYEFDDEVLQLAHIRKTVGPKTARLVFVEHEKEKNVKYEKETESLKTVLRSLHMLNNNTEEEDYQNNENEYNETLEEY